MTEFTSTKQTISYMPDNFRIDIVPGDRGLDTLRDSRALGPGRADGVAGCQAPRIVLYSHDTMGIGHVRRNLLLAQTISRAYPSASILMIAGAREASRFDAQCGIDFLTLPALSKGHNGTYCSRKLKIPLEDIVDIRRQTLEAAIWGFQPDLMIVDKVPCGAEGELSTILRRLAATGKSRLVLGLRDILDSPAAVAADWKREQAIEYMEHAYDEIWVYGDRNVCDPIREYELPSAVADKVRFVGYLDQRQRLLSTTEDTRREMRPILDLPDQLAVCLVGGGQDGADLALAFAAAELPADMRGVIVTGPFMPTSVRRQLGQCVTMRPRMQVLDFVSEVDLLVEQAQRVIAMGGYNTVSSILSFDKPALIVPRVSPRIEQQIRALRLADLGLVEVLHPNELRPQAISAWLAAAPRSRPSARHVVDMAGLDRVPQLVCNILNPCLGQVSRKSHWSANGASSSTPL